MPPNRDHKAYCREYYAEHRDEILAQKKTYQKSHQDQIAERKAIHYLEHAEEIKAKARAYYSEHKEAYNFRSKQYREVHADELREYTNEWRKTNHHMRTAQHHRRRYAECNGTHTADDIRAAYNEQDGLCFWCDCEVGGDWHVDHLIPLSRGGSNGPENLAITCRGCNLSKGAKDPLAFLEMVIQ